MVDSPSGIHRQDLFDGLIACTCTTDSKDAVLKAIGEITNSDSGQAWLDSWYQ